MAAKNMILLLLLFFFFHVNAILDPTDFLALQSIRKSLEDMPGSDFFSSWDFTSDPCNFSGVFCDSDKVISLNLGDPRAGSAGLTGRLDPAIETSSPLTGKIPPTVGSLPGLTNLILCHNRLSGSIPRFDSQSLSRLDLKHNSLTGSIGPNSLPPSLQYLSLSWNQLTGSMDRVLTRLEQLNYLDLSLNQFTGTVPGRIFSFPLTNLQLQRNQFTGSVEPVDQVAIPTVDLSYNRLSGQISPMLASVQNLYLNNNRFTGRVPASFVTRLLDASIQILYLQHNYLTGIEISPTAVIPERSSLCMQYNCMVPPVETPCPLRAGKQKTRPTTQCNQYNKG
ncbi:hypothetical protein P8452_09616 [Trifolium repens]|nr:hypothetical protein P8452_09616 [Trifolium repens]